MWNDSFTVEKYCGVVCICDMTHVNICNMTHVSKCDMAHSYTWHDSFIYVIWLIHIRDMTHWYVVSPLSLSRPLVRSLPRSLSCSRFLVLSLSGSLALWLSHALALPLSRSPALLLSRSLALSLSRLLLLSGSLALWLSRSLLLYTYRYIYKNVCKSIHTCTHIFIYMQESYHTYMLVKSHIWMRYAFWMRYVTNMNESRLTYGRIMSHTLAPKAVIRLKMCTVESCKSTSHSHTWHDSFLRDINNWYETGLTRISAHVFIRRKKAFRQISLVHFVCIYVYAHIYVYNLCVCACTYIHTLYIYTYMYTYIMMMIAFITIKSSLVPLIEGLCAQI